MRSHMAAIINNNIKVLKYKLSAPYASVMSMKYEYWYWRIAGQLHQLTTVGNAPGIIAQLSGCHAQLLSWSCVSTCTQANHKPQSQNAKEKTVAFCETVPIFLMLSLSTLVCLWACQEYLLWLLPTEIVKPSHGKQIMAYALSKTLS